MSGFASVQNVMARREAVLAGIVDLLARWIPRVEAERTVREQENEIESLRVGYDDDGITAIEIYRRLAAYRPKRRVRGGSGESVVIWKLYPAPVTRAQLEADFPSLYGREIHSAYDCTGKWFASAARVKRVGKRVLVRQWWGLDV